MPPSLQTLKLQTPFFQPLFVVLSSRMAPSTGLESEVAEKKTAEDEEDEHGHDDESLEEDIILAGSPITQALSLTTLQSLERRWGCKSKIFCCNT